MANVTSRLVNVIETTSAEGITYFTLEGVMIGGFKGGVRVPSSEPESAREPIKGGVVKSPTPQEVQRKKDKAVEAMQTPEGRLEHLKNDVV